jgi:hypothetical protein
MHSQRLNCNGNNCKLVGSCWGKKHWIGTCYQDLSLYETIFFAISPNCLLKSAWVGFEFPYAQLAHHKGVMLNTIKIIIKIKLPPHRDPTNWSNGNWNTTCSSRQKLIGMWVYSQGH